MVSCRYFLYNICGGKFFGDVNSKIIDKSLIKISEDLDICRILRRLHEIDKLKKALFDKE
jgi:hypothetical protein